MKNLTIITLLLANLFVLYSLYKTLNKNKQLDYSKKECEENRIYNMQKMEMANTCYKLELMLNNLVINKNLPIISQNHDTINIKDLISKKDKPLFFYFSNINCHSCVERVLDNLFSLQKKGKNIVVFAYFKHFHNYYSFQRNAKVNVYWITRNMFHE